MYRVRLFEWISHAILLEDGSYLAESQTEPQIEFSSYQDARCYCKQKMNSIDRIEAWIYGPDGVIMYRGGTEVILHHSGEYTVNLSWLGAFIRRRKIAR